MSLKVETTLCKEWTKRFENSTEMHWLRVTALISNSWCLIQCRMKFFFKGVTLLQAKKKKNKSNMLYLLLYFFYTHHRRIYRVCKISGGELMVTEMSLSWKFVCFNDFLITVLLSISDVAYPLDPPLKVVCTSPKLQIKEQFHHSALCPFSIVKHPR